MRVRRPTGRSVLLAAFAFSTALAVGGLESTRAEEPAPSRKPMDRATPPSIAGGENAPRANLSMPDGIAVTDILRNLSILIQRPITWSDQDKALTTRKLTGSGFRFQLPPDRIVGALRAMLASADVVLTSYGPSEAPMFLAMDARTLASQFILKTQPAVIDVTEAMIPMLSSQGGVLVTTTIRVSHLTELREVRTALFRILTPNNIGSVEEVPAARAFVVTDFAPNVAAIYATIRQLDVAAAAAPPADARRAASACFVLKHANARRVARLLKELFPPKAGDPIVTTPSDPAPRIASDEQTNQVIVIANAEDIATMREIVAHVDVEPAAAK